MALHEKHKDWIEARGISVELAATLGLATVQKDGAAWLAVPYVERGKVVNHKYRMISEKRHQMDKGGKLVLWNHDCLLEHSDKPVVICEGEWDAIVAMSLGWRAVSVPNGASSGGAYEYLWSARNELNAVKSFILATDSDEPGLALRADLVAHLGAGRCSFVDYGKGCKDLNDVLLVYGMEVVAETLNNAKAVPVQGLYTLDDFPKKPPLVTYPTGILPLEQMLYLVPGTLTVFTGYANAGKSTVINTVIASAIKRGLRVCVASFETDVPILRDHLAATMIGCGVHDLPSVDRTTADKLLRENLSIITQLVEEEEEMDLEAFLDLCRTAAVRNGVKLFILEPWNELEHKRRKGEETTDYIGRALRAIKRFAKEYDAIFWIVAHPAKPIDGKVKMPKLLDISGSANWANKPDYGLSYHRAAPDDPDKKHIGELCVTKVRMGYPGHRGKVAVTYNFNRSCFVALEPSNGN